MELKSQINKAEQEKDIITLEEIKENAEVGFEGEIAGLAKAALDRLHGKVEDAEKTPDHVVEKLGEEKLEEVTAEVDKEIEVLKEKTEEEIEGVVEQGGTIEEFNRLEKWQIDKLKHNLSLLPQRIEYLNYALGVVKRIKKSFEGDERTLSIPVSVSREVFRGDTVILEVPEVKEYEKLFKEELPENQYLRVSTYNEERFIGLLQKEGYTSEQIKHYNEIFIKLKSMRNDISNKYGGKILDYYPTSGELRTVLYFFAGSDAFHFENNSHGKIMAYGELLDQEEELKSQRLEEAKIQLEEMEKKKEYLESIDAY